MLNLCKELYFLIDKGKRNYKTKKAPNYIVGAFFHTNFKFYWHIPLHDSTHERFLV